MKIEIIAEIGQNHNGEIKKAVEMIKIVKECGADVAKFQLYNAKALFPKENNPWYDYNCKTELSKNDLHRLIDVCNTVGIEFMASVFDDERLMWLEDAGIARHKIASRTINDENLINKTLGTGKETLISLGMWNKSELPIFDGYNNYKFLSCISKYPTPLGDLSSDDMNFNRYFGFSDHTLGISAPVTAMVKGAKIIEKHFTLDKKLHGPDHECSMTPKELTQLVGFKNDLLEITENA